MSSQLSYRFVSPNLWHGLWKKSGPKREQRKSSNFSLLTLSLETPPSVTRCVSSRGETTFSCKATWSRHDELTIHRVTLENDNDHYKRNCINSRDTVHITQIFCLRFEIPNWLIVYRLVDNRLLIHVPSVGVKEVLSCVFSRAKWRGKARNLALLWLQHSV